MKAALLVFVVALVFHLAYFAFAPNHVARDTRKYLVPAENLLAGYGYTRNGQPETERAPGYPLVLAALRGVGLDLRQIALLQHLAAAAAAAALVLIARWMTGNAFIATVAGIVTAIDLPTIDHANLILTETLATILGLAVFALIWQGRTTAAGLLLGALTLVRPVAMLFFIPLALYLFWTRRSRSIPLFLVCALLPPAAWMYRNYRVSGVPTMSTNSANLMLNFHAAGALAFEDPGDFETNLIRRQQEVRALADARVRAELGTIDVPYVRRAAIDSRVGREIVLAHPIAFAKMWLWGVAVNFLGSGGTRLLLFYTGLAFVLAVVGEARLLKTNRRLGVLILITVAYFIAFTAGSISYSRFRVPVVPMYAIAIGAGVLALREAWIKQAAPVPQ